MNTYLKRSEIQYVHIEFSIINHIFNIKFDIYKIKILSLIKILILIYYIIYIYIFIYIYIDIHIQIGYMLRIYVL